MSGLPGTQDPQDIQAMLMGQPGADGGARQRWRHGFQPKFKPRFRLHRWLWAVALGWGVGALGQPAIAVDVILPDRCPLLFRPLIQELLPSLPSYINRVLIRERAADPDSPTPGAGESAPNFQPDYLLLVGKVDFRELSVAEFAQTYPHLDLGDLLTMPYLQQVFLTTLERHHGPQGSTTQQRAYWLFLRSQPLDHGWELVKVLTLPGNATGYATGEATGEATGDATGYATPATVPGSQPQGIVPQDRTDGPLAIAVRQQLQHCRIGWERSDP